MFAKIRIPTNMQRYNPSALGRDVRRGYEEAHWSMVANASSFKVLRGPYDKTGHLKIQKLI